MVNAMNACDFSYKVDGNFAQRICICATELCNGNEEIANYLKRWGREISKNDVKEDTSSSLGKSYFGSVFEDPIIEGLELNSEGFLQLLAIFVVIRVIIGIVQVIIKFFK